MTNDQVSKKLEAWIVESRMESVRARRHLIHPATALPGRVVKNHNARIYLLHLVMTLLGRPFK